MRTTTTTPTLYTTLTLAMMVFFCLLSLPFYGQDCATGYCPDIVTVHHHAGPISPVTVTINYKVVETTLADGAQATASCWIAQNLGATVQATDEADTRDASAGWYWQFNRKQGYAWNGIGGIRTPNTWSYPIDEDSDWLPENDPCTLLLGTGWRLPTNTEWTNVDANAGWTTMAQVFDNASGSMLKLHAAGVLGNESGLLQLSGTHGYYSSSVQASNTLQYIMSFSNNASAVGSSTRKEFGVPLRCLRAL